MESRLARIISVLFHPLLMPTYAFLLLLNMKAWFALAVPLQAKWVIVLMVFVATFCIPLIGAFLFYRKGIIRSFEMKSKEERSLPYLVTALSFYFAYYLLNRLDISPVYSYFMIGSTFLVVISLSVNFFWKISSHMVAAGAVTGMAAGISWIMGMNLTVLLVLSFVVSGLVAYSRLQLNAHRPAQVYVGYVAGAAVMAGLFLALGL